MCNTVVTVSPCDILILLNNVYNVLQVKLENFIHVDTLLLLNYSEMRAI